MNVVTLVDPSSTLSKEEIAIENIKVASKTELEGAKQIQLLSDVESNNRELKYEALISPPHSKN